MKIQDMDSMELDEVRKEVNDQLQHCGGSLSTWLNYYLTRKQDETNEQLNKINHQMLVYTRITIVLTVVATLSTIIATVCTVVSILKIQ